MKKSHFWFALLFAGALSIGVGTSSQTVSAKTVNIYLTRHGQTMFNVNGRGQGWADSPLTDTGVSVAHQLGYGLYGLKFKAAYSADNMRTFRTATYALQSSGNGNLKVNWTANLREGGYGSFEGQKYDDVNKITMPLLKPAGTYSGPQDFGKAQQALGKDFWPALQDAYHAAETVDFGKYSDPTLPESIKAESSTQEIDRKNTELTYIAQKAEKTGGNVLVVSSGMSIPVWLSSQKNYTVPGFVNWGNEATMKVTYKNGQFYFPSNVTDKTILYTINKGAALQQLPKNTLKVKKFYLNKNKVSGSTSTGASLVLQNTKGSTLKKANANSNGNFVFKLSKATLNKLKKGMNLKLTSTPKNASKSLNMNSDQISQTVFGNKTATIKVLK